MFMSFPPRAAQSVSLRSTTATWRDSVASGWSDSRIRVTVTTSSSEATVCGASTPPARPSGLSLFVDSASLRLTRTSVATGWYMARRPGTLMSTCCL